MKAFLLIALVCYMQGFVWGYMFDLLLIEYRMSTLWDTLHEQQRDYSVRNGCCILTRLQWPPTHCNFFALIIFYRESKEDQRRFYNVRVADVAIYITFNSALPSLLSLFIRSHCHCADRLAAMIMNHFLWLLPLVFPHLSSPVILLERSDGNLFHWNHLMEGDKLVLHRSKRDWMWRQFFLSEEYTGSNYQYVGKVSVHDNGPRRSLLV